jgi:hypothetical protein
MADAGAPPITNSVEAVLDRCRRRRPDLSATRRRHAAPACSHPARRARRARIQPDGMSMRFGACQNLAALACEAPVLRLVRADRSIDTTLRLTGTTGERPS